MLQETGIVSRDLAAARRFYAATARSLGLAIIEAQEDSFTLGRVSDMSTPVLRVNKAAVRSDEPETQPSVVSLEAPDDYTVRAFYRAALEAGGWWQAGGLSRAAAHARPVVLLCCAGRRPGWKLH